MVRIKAPAKINLSLKVLGKLGAYHEVEMVMTTIDLSDYITITKTPESTEKIVLKSDSPSLPLGSNNLVYQAAELIIDYAGITDSVEIYIEKNIPVSAGLAGGSTDAAATFKGLNELFGLNLSDDILCELGAKIGSDIPFCIIGNTALATGRGEIITPIKSPPRCWVIVINPRVSVSTRDIYSNFSFAEADDIDTSLMLNAIENENFDGICIHLANHLEHVTKKIHPFINDIQNELHANGANGVRMSGSGPTVFALVYTEKKANQLYNHMKKTFAEYTVVLTRLLG